MLEFAYTGEVNVAQELLPSLLHTARSFRIKGLDKVEDPGQTSRGPEAQTPSSEHWMESAPPTRSHSPSSIHSQQDVKPPHLSNEHFMSMSNNDKAAVPATPVTAPAANGNPVGHVVNAHTSSGFNGLLRSAEREREREMQNHQLARLVLNDTD